MVSYRITAWFILNSYMFKQFHILWEFILFILRERFLLYCETIFPQ